MNLAAYLKMSGERPGAFGRRIGVKASTISGWLNNPGRGPSRASLVAIEAATGGLVTAKDFAPGEQCADEAARSAHESVSPAADVAAPAQPAAAPQSAPEAA